MCEMWVTLMCAAGQSLSDCSACTAGYYCEQPGLDKPTDLCSRGYYCPGPANVSVPDPTEYECPEGTHVILSQSCRPSLLLGTMSAHQLYSNIVLMYHNYYTPAGQNSSSHQLHKNIAIQKTHTKKQQQKPNIALLYYVCVCQDTFAPLAPRSQSAVLVGKHSLILASGTASHARLVTTASAQWTLTPYPAHHTTTVPTVSLPAGWR